MFAEAERAQVQALLDQMEHALAAGTMASLPTALEGYWPQFLTATVTEEQAAIAEKRKARRAARRAKAETQTAENPDGLFDRVRNWWRRAGPLVGRGSRKGCPTAQPGGQPRWRPPSRWM